MHAITKKRLLQVVENLANSWGPKEHMHSPLIGVETLAKCLLVHLDDSDGTDVAAIIETAKAKAAEPQTV